jgi:hypothetical protein
LFEFDDRFVDDAYFQDLPSNRHANQQGCGKKVIILAGNAFGLIKNASQGVIGKEGTSLVASKQHIATDVCNGLAEVQRQQVEGSGQLLGKGFVGSPAQFRVAYQEQSTEGLAVHVGTEEQANWIEGGIGEGMGFIQDDHWETVLTLDQILKDRAVAGHHLWDD